METLEAIGIPESQIDEQLSAKMEFIDNVERPEDLMVVLSGIAKKIIEKTPIDGQSAKDYQISYEPTPAQVRLQAAKMTLCYLALLS